MRYIISLAYDGSAFSGWQVQPGQPTVQGSVEAALRTLLKEEITLVGAGRTDTGVNALEYFAHFDTDAPIAYEPRDFVYKLNAITPREIVIFDVFPTRADFHARFDATARSYTYFLHTAEDPFVARHSWLYKAPLDFEKMNEAAALIPGRRDFSCFEKTGGSNVTSICDVTEAFWAPYTPGLWQVGGDMPEQDGRTYWYFRITADRFLRNMVRAVVGSLIEVGRGKEDPSWIGDLISSGTRSDAGESVPGHALFLSKIRYSSLK
ncbi:MAG: tRNA pseudouridine(38-40) synthase TruA [Bacteroidales bacterium]|nr:tRNA pseudouridine(38-40) synthase TruA [Bacteroidales bacterium]